MAVERQTEYETVFILRPTIEEADKVGVRDRIQGIVENAGGHTLKFDDWGTRKLSYRVRDALEAKYYDQGNYQYFRYLGPQDVVAEIERNLRIIDTVLKFMTVRIEEGLIPQERLDRPPEPEQE